MFVYVLCTVGIFVSIPDSYSFSLSERHPLLIALLLSVASAGILAYVYSRVVETTIACLLFVWAFALSLNVFQIPQEAHGIAYVLWEVWCTHLLEST